ncbi:MAG: prolyl oligopeptidase family serine peptidase, partial [Bacteroidota bacterium]
NKVQGLGNKYLHLFYKVKRVWATAEDGSKIPISLVYSRYNMDKDGADRLWLTAYGAYGTSYDVGFSQSVLNLLELGFVYAVAHVRGGRDCGQQWYEEGKLLNKKNTFTDFISCAEFLIKEKYTASDRLVIQGGSAGGLLMGAVTNMRPDLFHTVVLDVPFVDVLNTMNDPGLPLTTLEYKEWGPPQIKKYFKYMRSYSPYDNIRPQNYPNMLFFTALNDTRVGYWEPAKMVAKLRDTKTDQNLTLLKTNFSAGHGGNSGRFAHYREMAYKLALVLDLLKKNPFAHPEAGE